MLKRKLNKWIILVMLFSFTVVFTGCRNELTEDSNIISNTTSDSESDTTTDDTTTDVTTTDDTTTDEDTSTISTVESFVPYGVWVDTSVVNPVGGNNNSFDFKVSDDVIFNVGNNWQSNTLSAALVGDDGFSITISTEAEQGWWAQTNADFSGKLETGKTYQIVITAKASEVSRFKASVNFTDSDRCVDGEISVTTEYQTFKYEFTATDAITDPDTSIERLQLSMGNDTYEEGSVSIVTTGVTFYINQLTIELVE